jgi:hypothetical protein
MKEKVRGVCELLKNYNYSLWKGSDWESGVDDRPENIEISFLSDGVSGKGYYPIEKLPKCKEEKYRGFIFRIFAKSKTTICFQVFIVKGGRICTTYIPEEINYKGRPFKYNHIDSIEIEDVGEFISELFKKFF